MHMSEKDFQKFAEPGISTWINCFDDFYPLKDH